MTDLRKISALAVVLGLGATACSSTGEDTTPESEQPEATGEAQQQEETENEEPEEDQCGIPEDASRTMEHRENAHPMLQTEASAEVIPYATPRYFDSGGVYDDIFNPALEADYSREEMLLWFNYWESSGSESDLPEELPVEIWAGTHVTSDPEECELLAETVAVPYERDDEGNLGNYYRFDFNFDDLEDLDAHTSIYFEEPGNPGQIIERPISYDRIVENRVLDESVTRNFSDAVWRAGEPNSCEELDSRFDDPGCAIGKPPAQP